MRHHAFKDNIWLRTVQRSFFLSVLKQLNTQAPKIDLEIKYARLCSQTRRIRIIQRPIKYVCTLDCVLRVTFAINISTSRLFERYCIDKKVDATLIKNSICDGMTCEKCRFISNVYFEYFHAHFLKLTIIYHFSVHSNKMLHV